MSTQIGSPQSTLVPIVTSRSQGTRGGSGNRSDHLALSIPSLRATGMCASHPSPKIRSNSLCWTLILSTWRSEVKNVKNPATMMKASFSTSPSTDPMAPNKAKMGVIASAINLGIHNKILNVPERGRSNVRALKIAAMALIIRIGLRIGCSPWSPRITEHDDSLPSLVRGRLPSESPSHPTVYFYLTAIF